MIQKTRVAGEITYQVVKLHRSDTAVDAGDDLLSNGNGVDMVGIQAVTQPGDTSCDLVELNALLASIYMVLSHGHTLRKLEGNLPRFLTYMAKEHGV